MTLRVLDLFSGIGGFSLGLERAGMQTVAFCEIEPFCRRVLAKHWPGVPIYDDVRELTAARLAVDGIGVDVICGGFPCQDISVAGKGAGLAGERSGLWREYARIIGEVRPRFVIVENVSALLHRGLGDVLGDLAALGYDAEWHCIPASAVGAPHRRDRVWIIAHADIGQVQHHFAADSGNGGQISAQGQQRVIRRGGGSEDVADSDNSGRRQQWRPFAIRAELAAAQCGGWWRTEPDVGRVAHGVPFELDRIERVTNELVNRQKAVPEIEAAVWKMLRYVWQQRETAASSSDLYRRGLLDCVPEVPCGNPQGGWLLGKRIEAHEGLRDLWNSFYSKSQQEAQDMQRVLLERIRQTQRPQEVAPRVDRLKALGNAVVPQIPELIGRAILASGNAEFSPNSPKSKIEAQIAGDDSREKGRR